MDKLIQSVTALIDEGLGRKRPLLVAIDGRCASGKTTLAGYLKAHYDCNVIHMDHFFLRPEQRTAERLNTPGENVDHERFLEEVLLPLREGREFSYRPFDCSCQALAEPVTIVPGNLTVIEGSYSCHPQLWEQYDLHLFLTVSPEEQMRRIHRRNGAQMAKMFENRWIPLEERYFSAFDFRKKCDLYLNTD